MFPVGPVKRNIVHADTVDHMLPSVHYDPSQLMQAPSSRRKTSAQKDAAEALKSLLTEQRRLHLYLEM